MGALVDGSVAVRALQWELQKLAGRKFFGFNGQARETVVDPRRTRTPHSTYGGVFLRGVKSLFTQSAGGYTFAGHLYDHTGKPIENNGISTPACPATMRLTAADYTVVPDQSVRYVYIKDHSTGQVWNPGRKPTLNEPDKSEVVFGQNYEIIKAEKDGLAVQHFMMTDVDHPVEIRQIAITNNGADREIEVYVADAFCKYDIDGELFNKQRGYNTGRTEVETVGDATVTHHDTEVVFGTRNYSTFRADYFPVDGVDTDMLNWAGQNNGMQRPQAIFDPGYVFPEKPHTGGQPCAAVKTKKMLIKHGETIVLHSALGIAENPQTEKFDPPESTNINRKRAHELVELFRKPESVKAAFEKLLAANKERYSSFQCETGVPEVDNLMNWLLQFQVGENYELSRSTSTTEPGKGRGLGFRDSSQDTPAFAHMALPEAEQRMLDILSTQFRDGGNFHQFMPLSRKGNAEIGGDFFDDPLWPILSIWSLVAERGDTRMLEAKVRWSANPALNGTETATDLAAVSVMDHLKASIDHVLNNLGPHQLPLIGRADWNDCLNLNIDLALFLITGGSYQCAPQIKENRVAESIMIAGLFVEGAKKYAELCRLKGDVLEAARVEGAREKMIENIKRHAWCEMENGEGYWGRAFDRHSQPIGFWNTPRQGGKIFVEGIAWCTIAGVGAEEGMRKKALAALKKYLTSQYGVALCWPAFQKFDGELGEITAYPPGVKENAGIFVHNNLWVVIAYLLEGDRESVESAWEIINAITPPLFDEERAKVHAADVTGVPQMISGPESDNPGYARNPHLTGGAGWEFVALSQFMLGVRPELTGLRIDPRLPLAFGEIVKVSRKFQGDIYDITINNPDKVPSGVLSVTIDGVENTDGNLIKPFHDGKTHKVVVTMGTKPAATVAAAAA